MFTLYILICLYLEVMIYIIFYFQIQIIFL